MFEIGSSNTIKACSKDNFWKKKTSIIKEWFQWNYISVLCMLPLKLNTYIFQSQNISVKLDIILLNHNAFSCSSLTTTNCLFFVFFMFLCVFYRVVVIVSIVFFPLVHIVILKEIYVHVSRRFDKSTCFMPGRTFTRIRFHLLQKSVFFKNSILFLASYH